MMTGTDSSILYSSVSVAAAALLAIMSGFIISKVIGSASEIDSLRGRASELESKSSRLQLDMDERRRRITEISRSLFLETASEIYSDSDDLESLSDEVRRDLMAHDPGGGEWLSTVQSSATILGQRIQNSFEGNELDVGEIEIRNRVGDLSPLENELFSSILLRELARRRGIQWFGRKPNISLTGPEAKFVEGVSLVAKSQETAMDRLRQASEQLGRGTRRSNYLRNRQIEFDSITELARQLGEVKPILETVSLQMARIRGAGDQKGPLLFLLGLLLIGVIYPLVLLALNPVPSGSVYRFSSIVAFLIVFLGEGGYLWRVLGKPIE